MAQHSGRTRHPRAGHAYWMVPLAAPTIVLTCMLVALGERGTTLATVLSLPVAIYGVAATIFARIERSTAYRAPVSIRRKTTISVVTLLVGAVLPAIGWICYARYTNVSVRVGAAFQISTQAPVTIVPKLARSGWRGRLTFTPRLAASRSLGDCVLPARLMITPVVDGEALPVEEARHDSKTEIAIPSGAQAVELHISLIVPPGDDCPLTVTLARAVLDRTPLWLEKEW
jgi:hypothetical protein